MSQLDTDFTSDFSVLVQINDFVPNCQQMFPINISAFYDSYAGFICVTHLVKSENQKLNYGKALFPPDMYFL